MTRRVKVPEEKNKGMTNHGYTKEITAADKNGSILKILFKVDVRAGSFRFSSCVSVVVK